MSDPSENVDQPMSTREEAARAIVNYFLANAEAGNHAANDELIAELARRQRERYEGVCPGVQGKQEGVSPA